MTTAQVGFELSGESTPVVRLVRDAWGARALVRSLARRDFFVRYRRPTFGVVWAIIVPVVQAAVMAIVFTRIVRVETTLPYVLFILSGVIPWTFFSSTITGAVRSITGGSGIASKVYFPRCVLPLANVGTSIYGYVPSLFVLVIVALLFGVDLSFSWLLLIPATLVMVVFTSVLAMFLAAIQVYFRDVAYIVGAVIQAWFYGSAVFFPVTMTNGLLRQVILANPATGMVELFRASFDGLHPWTLPALGWTLAWTLAILLADLLIYRRYDRVFVDLL
jgi:ABC-type polysaccharide/polyol phosphate export permease